MPEKTLRDEILENFYLAITVPTDRSRLLKKVISVTSLSSDCYRQMYYRALFPIDLYDPQSAIRMWIGRKLHETNILGGDMEVEIEWNGNYTLVDLDTKVSYSLLSQDIVEIHDIDVEIPFFETNKVPIYAVFNAYCDNNSQTHRYGVPIKYKDATLKNWVIRHDELGLYGHIDEYHKKRKILLEKKTTRKIPRDAYEHHKKQVFYYAVMLNSIGFEVDTVAIMYINVDEARVQVFVLEPPDLWDVQQEMSVKFEVIKKALKQNILPPRYLTTWDENTYRVKCEYCPFFGLCMSEDVTSNISLVRKALLEGVKNKDTDEEGESSENY